jgi:WD40 repeat protein
MVSHSRVITMIVRIGLAIGFAWPVGAREALAQYPPVASGGADRAIRVFSPEGVETYSFVAHEGAVNALLFSPDGRRMISGGEDGTIKVWNVDDGSLENSVDAHEKAVLALALKDDGSALASGGSDGKVKLWAPATVKLLHTIPAHARPVRALSWSPDGKLLASGGEDRVIQVWRDDGSQAASIVGHDEAITGLAWTRDGRSLISGAADGYVKVWSAGDFALASRHRTNDKSLAALVATADGQLLATAGADGRIRVYTITGKGISEIVSKLLERQVLCMAWSRDGKVLVTGGAGRSLRYWKGSDLSVLLRVSGGQGTITAIAVDPR